MKKTYAIVLFSTLALAGFLATCGSPPESPASGAWLEEILDEPAYQEACAEVAGCGRPAFEASGPAETIWRVRVERVPSGEVKIAEIEAIDVPEGDGVPVGNVDGTHALIGLDGNGDPVEGQPIHFPRVLRIEYENGPPELRDLSNQTVDTLGYLRTESSIASIAVLDPAGETVAETPIPQRVAAARSGIPGLATPAFAIARPWSGLPPYCSHVLVIEGESDRARAQNVQFGEQVTLARPGPWQLATVQGALARMTPLLCQSIGRIAFGYAPEHDSVLGAVNSFGAGDMILINLSASRHSEESLQEKLSSRLMLQGTVIHEAGHAAETLLTVEGDRPLSLSDLINDSYSGSWGHASRTLAKRTIANVRLDKGLPAEWQRLHASFVNHGWASDYISKEELDALSRAGVAESGFMRRYGGNNWAEDIATFVEAPYLGPDFTAGLESQGRTDLRQDLGCETMQAHDRKGVPARLAAVYTKLLFLHDLGLVTKEGVDWCTGANLGLPIDEEGFHFWQGTMELRKFRNELEAGIGTRQSGKRVFQLQGKGEANFGDGTYPASLRLQLDLGGRFDSLQEVSWPRGIYELGLFGDNNLELRLDGAKAGNFDAKDGFVLVAEASNERIAGSIFLTQAFRLNAPLPVPQVFDPPLNIRFLIEN